MSDTPMNRRSFLGACSALLALPAVALVSRSVPGFMFVPPTPRLYYTPYGELDWIEMPTNIIELVDAGDFLRIKCVGGDYLLFHRGSPEQDWFIRRA
jgi:hypothetical protein